MLNEGVTVGSLSWQFSVGSNG